MPVTDEIHRERVTQLDFLKPTDEQEEEARHSSTETERVIGHAVRAAVSQTFSPERVAPSANMSQQVRYFLGFLDALAEEFEVELDNADRNRALRLFVAQAASVQINDLITSSLSHIGQRIVPSRGGIIASSLSRQDKE